MKALSIAWILAPFLAAAAVRWWRARRHVRSRERWILWVPIGGSVVVGFRSDLSLGRRALVLVGAAAASYLMAAVLALLVAAAAGLPGGNRYQVSAVTPGMAADGRLAPGDRLEALDGAPLSPDDRTSLVGRVEEAGERPMRFAVVRGERAVMVEVTPRPTDEGRLRLGIDLVVHQRRDRPGATAALAHSLALPGRKAAVILAVLWQNVFAGPEEHVHFMGPIGIGYLLWQIEGTTEALDLALAVAVYYLVMTALVDLVLLFAMTGLALWRARVQRPMRV